MAKIWRHLRLVALATIAACGTERTTSPTVIAPTAPNSALVGTLTGLRPLQRRVPLARDISVSATIGAAGGRISIPAAGFQLVIPEGVVSARTTFTVTALQGTAIAYEFAPHGLVFARQLQAAQDLSVARGVLELAPLLKAGYFPDRGLISASGFNVFVSEIFEGTTNLRLGIFRWGIPHFSGYIVAW